VREFFTEDTNEVAPDLLCCKMTLEHIGQTHRFLACVRSVANCKDSVIFFQVPDVARILREGAFWDIYYEHCSYFSAISLKRLFTRTGFAVPLSRTAWVSRLRDWAAAGQRTVLWGSGSKAVAFLTTLGVHEEVEHVVDINPYRVGKFLPGTGQRIVAPAFLREYLPDNVVIMNPVYRREVGQELARQRCEPNVYTILDFETEPA
jgi:hypothetical protein